VDLSGSLGSAGTFRLVVPHGALQDMSRGRSCACVGTSARLDLHDCPDLADRLSGYCPGALGDCSCPAWRRGAPALAWAGRRPSGRFACPARRLGGPAAGRSDRRIRPQGTETGAGARGAPYHRPGGGGLGRVQILCRDLWTLTLFPGAALTLFPRVWLSVMFYLVTSLSVTSTRPGRLLGR
jgi:hypothetical protein